MAEMKSLTINDVKYDVVDATAVKFVEQELTEEQKAQARENIGAMKSSATTIVETEELEFTYTHSYANNATFEYAESAAPAGYWFFKQSTFKGGLLSVDWDTTQLTQIQIILYLFDADGNPYLYTQLNNSGEYLGQTAVIEGELVELNWMPAGLGSGFCNAKPFSTQIPDDCSVMICMRSANAVFPDASTVKIGFYNYAPTFFNVSLSKEVNETNDIAAVLYTEQELTEEQKAQARANIGAIGAGGTRTETLEFVDTTTYPNDATFEYVENSYPTGYGIFKPGEILGGLLSVDWDTSQVTQFDIILYLFDKNGNPYKYVQAGSSYGTQAAISGENASILWIPAGVGSGYCKAAAPFTVQIPEDCSVMISVRITNAIFPAGSNYNSSNFSDFLGTFVTVTVSKTEGGMTGLTLGEANANRQLITDSNGNIIAGDINPKSTILRGNWDTVIHRGWISGATENTLPAFFLAKENGYDWVECDVRVTSDNVPVLAHDATVTGLNSSGTSVTLTVASTTLANLQAVTLSTHARFGTIKTNTLAELLEMARVLGMKVLIDIKVSGEAAMKAIAQTVLRYGMSKNVVYMPIGTINASYIASVDKNASFDFVASGTSPTATTDFSTYTALLTGANQVNFDIQANTWGFAQADIDAINAAGLGLTFWNVLQSNLAKCLDAGAVRITKHNQEDAVNLDEIYLATKTYW